MPHHPYRDQPAVERKFVTVELAERWLALASRAILLLLTLGLGGHHDHLRATWLNLDATGRNRGH
jgi:hypothetical protein